MEGVVEEQERLARAAHLCPLRGIGASEHALGVGGKPEVQGMEGQVAHGVVLVHCMSLQCRGEEGQLFEDHVLASSDFKSECLDLKQNRQMSTVD